MMKKILLLAAFAITPIALSQTASAHCGPGHGYGHYRRAPVVTYRVPHHHHHYRSSYRYGHPGIRYGSPVRAGYGYGYGGIGYGGIGYGHPLYYGRGTSVGIGRGGFSLRIGF